VRGKNRVRGEEKDLSLLTTVIATYCDAPFLPSFNLPSTWPSAKIGNAHKGENAITFETRPQLKIGRLVIDPFSGSASTGVAALLLGQDYVGFDTDSNVFTPAATRLKAVRDAITRNGERAYHEGLRVALARSDDTEQSLKKKLGRFTEAFPHLRGDPDAPEEQEEDSQDVQRTRVRAPPNTTGTGGPAGSTIPGKPVRVFNLIDDQAGHSGADDDDEGAIGDDPEASDVDAKGNIANLIDDSGSLSGTPPKSVHPPEQAFKEAAKKAGKKLQGGSSSSSSSSSGSSRSSSGSSRSSSGSSRSSSGSSSKPQQPNTTRRQVIPATQETVVEKKQAAIKRKTAAAAASSPTPKKKSRQEMPATQESVEKDIQAAKKRLAISSKTEALELMTRRRSGRAGNK
jgi:hypothetical protein